MNESLKTECETCKTYTNFTINKKCLKCYSQKESSHMNFHEKLISTLIYISIIVMILLVTYAAIQLVNLIMGLL